MVEHKKMQGGGGAKPSQPTGLPAWVRTTTALAVGCLAVVTSVSVVDRTGQGPGRLADQTADLAPSTRPVPDAAPQRQPPVALPQGPGADVQALVPLPEPVGPLPTTQPFEIPKMAPTGVDTAALKAAVEFYRRGDVAGGDAARAVLTDSAARSLLEWVAIRTNGRAVGLDRLTAFLMQRSDWPGVSLIQRRAEEAIYYEKRPSKTVLDFFATRQPVSAAGRLALAGVARQQGREADADALVRAVWREEALTESTEKTVMAAYPTVLTRDEHRNRMEFFLFKEQWDQALRAARYAGDDYVKLAKARIAAVKTPTKAKAALDAVPAALRSDTSYGFSRAHYLRKTEQFAEAAKIHNATTRDPAILIDGDEWWAERRILARKLLEAGDAKGAYDVVAGHGAESDRHAIEAEFHAGWIALRFLHDAKLATEHFDAAAKRAETPVSVSRMAYWQGRAAEAAGDKARARQDYERAAAFTTTYYGQIARVKIGLDDLPLRAAPPGVSPALDSMEPLRGVRMLYEIGAKDLATQLFIGLAQTLTEPRQLQDLAVIAAAYGDARAMVLIGKAAMQRGYPLDMAAFPLIGLPDYEVIGDPVERPMVYAIARQESVFDPTAQSQVGARGLMQLMPATAKNTATRSGVPFDVDRLTSDAAYNAKLGARHLRELLDDWRGSYIMAFAAYNAGGGNVRKWIKTFGDPRLGQIDPVDWVELIPFSETRNYVQRVMENLQVYRHRLGVKTTTLISDDLQRGTPRPVRTEPEKPVRETAFNP